MTTYGSIAPAPRSTSSSKSPLHDGRLRANRPSPERHAKGGGKALKSAVYGAIDGVLTAYAIVSGGAGGDLPVHVVLVLGISSLFANAFSMGIGDIVSTLSYRDHVAEERRREEWEFDNFPEGEIQEMVDLYENRGLPREKAELAVATMAKYKEFFLDVMVTEELGLQMPNTGDDPYKSGLITGISFLVFGSMPLLGYAAFLGRMSETNMLYLSTLSTLLSLFVLGALKSRFSVVPWWRGGLEFCVMGGCVAFAAFTIGSVVSTAVKDFT